MKRIICCILFMTIFAATLSGCDILTVARKCATCGLNRAIMHKVISGDDEFYQCSDCTYVWGLAGYSTYRQWMKTVQANCYYCKRDVKCSLVNLGKQGDKYDRYMAVCASCKAFRDHYATSLVK